MTRQDVCDGCGEVRPRIYEDVTGYYSWISVDTNEDVDRGDFCPWSCLASWSVTRAVEREGQLNDEPTDRQT